MSHAGKARTLPLAGAFALVAAFLLAPPAALGQISGSAILLVASEKMPDPRFAKTVVLVTRHGRSTPLGVIINRPLRVTLGEVFPDLKKPSSAAMPLFLGGPVAPEMLVFLFRSKEPAPPDAITVAADIHLGRAATTLADILNGHRMQNGLKVFAGYSGWGAGQLEKEIAHGDWFVQAVSAEYLFDKNNDEIWPDLIRRATQTMARTPEPFPYANHPQPTIAFLDPSTPEPSIP